MAFAGLLFFFPAVGLAARPWRDVPLAALLALVLVLTVRRLGLVSSASAIFCAMVLGLVPPLTLGTTPWYLDRTLVAAGLVGSLAVASFVIALGGRSPFGQSLSDL